MPWPLASAAAALYRSSLRRASNPAWAPGRERDTTNKQKAMARTRNSVKRQRVVTVESALFKPDVVFLLAALLDARDLCQVSLTCKTLGVRRRQAGRLQLSLVEEAARRMFECAATAWER